MLAKASSISSGSCSKVVVKVDVGGGRCGGEAEVAIVEVDIKQAGVVAVVIAVVSRISINS